MPNKLKQMEARITSLEKELGALRARLSSGKPKPWYREIVGAFAGDRDYAEICRLGQQIRKAERKKAR